MKKAVSILLLFVLVFSLAACGGNNLNGSYYNETSGQTLELKDGIATWTEMGMSFKGTYEVKGKDFTLTMSGGGLVDDKVFTGTVDGSTITLTGASLSADGEAFVKQ